MQAIPLVVWLRPVSRHERVGEHSAVVWKFVYLRPLSAMRLMFGVSIIPPYGSSAEKPTSSKTTYSTLGAPSGGNLGGALPVIVALAEQGPTAATIVLIEILLYQLLENSVLSPRISAKTIELNPGLAFGAAMAGGAVGGFVGAFFALPITATIQTFMSTYAKGYAVTDSALTHLDAPAPAAPPNSDRRRHRHRPEPEPAGTPAPNPRDSDPS
jgi:hypothetical protein